MTKIAIMAALGLIAGALFLENGPGVTTAQILTAVGGGLTGGLTGSLISRRGQRPR